MRSSPIRSCPGDCLTESALLGIYVATSRDLTDIFHAAAFFAYF